MTDFANHTQGMYVGTVVMSFYRYLLWVDPLLNTLQTCSASHQTHIAQVSSNYLLIIRLYLRDYINCILITVATEVNLCSTWYLDG